MIRVKVWPVSIWSVFGQFYDVLFFVKRQWPSLQISCLYIFLLQLSLFDNLLHWIPCLLRNSSIVVAPMLSRYGIGVKIVWFVTVFGMGYCHCGFCACLIFDNEQNIFFLPRVFRLLLVVLLIRSRKGLVLLRYVHISIQTCPLRVLFNKMKEFNITSVWSFNVHPNAAQWGKAFRCWDHVVFGMIFLFCIL